MDSKISLFINKFNDISATQCLPTYYSLLLKEIVHLQQNVLRFNFKARFKPALREHLFDRERAT